MRRCSSVQHKVKEWENLRFRIRQKVGMAWFLELIDILSSNITSGGLVS